MKDILIIYGIPTEIVNEILMLYKNIRTMVRSPDGDTHFFDITTGVQTEINFHNLYACVKSRKPYKPEDIQRYSH